MQEDATDVLVVGAGPAGLAAALELTRHGIPTRLVERRAVLSGHPRATALSLRSMELVRAWGLEAGVRARSVAVDWRMLECETLADAAAGTPLTVGYPNQEHSRMVSPTAPACVAQDDLEPLLLEHLPRESIELGAELVGFIERHDGIRAHLADGRTVQARYLVAADGARSRIRAALGIRLVGPEHLMVGFTTLFRAPLWDVVDARRHILYSVTHPEVPSSFLPAGRDRWLLGAGRGGGGAPSEREVVQLIRLGAGVADLPVRVVGTREFSSAAQIAEQWRSGRVLLAGDAAHRVTPRGGTGLNIALHDGYDLGWRLAWVLRGWAPPGLLDAYEAERRPVAEYATTRSADPRGSIRPVEQEVRVDIGGRIPHVAVADGSTLDLLGPGLTLFTGGPGWDAAAADVAARVPIAVHRLDPVAARALGAPTGAALLARSDGTPVGVLPSTADPAPALRAAVAAVAT